MNTTGKALIHSWTFWLAIAQFAIAIIVAVQADLSAYIPGTVLAVILGIKSLLDVFVRMNTAQPITSVLPTPSQ